MNKIDFLEKNLSRQLKWIQSADTRIALVLPLSTAMLGALSVLSPEVDKWSNLSAISVSFAVLFLSLSIIFSAIASFPRTNGPKSSLIYFVGISDNDTSQYKEAVNEIDEEKYQNDLASQCHVNAQVAIIKYSWVKRSMGCLFLSSFPWAIAVFLLYNTK